MLLLGAIVWALIFPSSWSPMESWAPLTRATSRREFQTLKGEGNGDNLIVCFGKLTRAEGVATAYWWRGAADWAFPSRLPVQAWFLLQDSCSPSDEAHPGSHRLRPCSHRRVPVARAAAEVASSDFRGLFSSAAKMPELALGKQQLLLLNLFWAHHLSNKKYDTFPKAQMTFQKVKGKNSFLQVV